MSKVVPNSCELVLREALLLPRRRSAWSAAGATLRELSDCSLRRGRGRFRESLQVPCRIWIGALSPAGDLLEKGWFRNSIAWMMALPCD